MSDLRITIGATTKDFNLAIEERRKLFNVREEPIVPIRQLSDVPSYGDLPPEKVLAFVQNNWRGGMGQKNHFLTPDMYADGQSIDTREPNQIILGPLINTIGAVADTIVYQLFFENREYVASTTVLYRLSADSATWDTVFTLPLPSSPLTLRPNTVGSETSIGSQFPASGDHYDKVDEASPDDNTTYVESTANQRDLYGVPDSDPNRRGTISSVTVYIRCINTLGGTAVVNPSIRTNSATYDGDSAEVGSGAYSTVSYSWATNPNTSIAWTWDEIDALEIGVRLSNSGSRCTQVYAEIAYTPVQTDYISCLGVYDNYIFIGSNLMPYYYSSTGDSSSWTQSTLDNAIAHEFTVAPPFSGTKDLLVLAQRPNIVRTSISPLNAGTGWIDPPYYIGDESSDITSLLILNGTLFIGKDDGFYALPVDGRPVKVLDYAAQKSSDNFAHHTNWQGITYIAAAGDILEIIGGSSSVFAIDYVGPLHKSPELATIGTIQSITSDDKNIYALYKIGSNYIIYAGRERRDETYGLRWEWTPYINLSTNVSASIQVMQRTSASPKLWFAYGTNMANAILAKAPNLPLGDSAYRFCAQGYLITSYFDAGYDIWQKLFYQLWTIAENLTANIKITVTYQKDTDSSWSPLATVTSNGVQSVDLSALAGKKFRLKIQLDTNDSEVTPILREFIFRGVLQPEITRTLDFVVVLEQSSSRKVSSDLTFLEGGRTATSPITLKDLRFGTTKSITFLPNSPMEIEVWDEVSKQPSYRARILAQQLNWTSP